MEKVLSSRSEKHAFSLPQHIIIYKESNDNGPISTTSVVDDNGNYNNKNKISFIATSSSLLKENESSRGRIVGVVPMYIKSCSLGEFILNQAFAQAAYKIIKNY